MSIFEKLLAIKEVGFSDGKITMSGQRVLIIPQEFALALTEQMVKNKELVGPIYESTRKAVSIGWADLVKRRYKFEEDPRKFIEWLIEMGMFVGWGKHELVKLDSVNREGILRTHDAPIGTYYKNKFACPVDHVWRALTAGCATAAFQQDTDWIEINCVATGSPYCEFLFKPRKNLTNEEKQKYKDQLPKL